MEFIIITVILLFIVTYRKSSGEGVYKFFKKQASIVYDQFAPYSYKTISSKIKELGLNYTPRQYLMQIVLFAGGAAAIGYLYFYNLVVSVIYAILAVSIIPYLTYLRCKRQYSEFIFEQVQVYTTNTIMEFATTQSFVKALEGVVESGVLEDPVLSDVKTMIALSYDKGDVSEAIAYMNSKYPYYMVKNMHQLFLQITKEGAKDTEEILDNMLNDIDLLVEGVYRDRSDRSVFHKQFLTFGFALFSLIILVQFILGQESYISMLDNIFMAILIHCVPIVNTYFLLKGEKFYNENVGAE